jgi:hypothetical protein
VKDFEPLIKKSYGINIFNCLFRQNGTDFSAGSPLSLPLPDFSDGDSEDSRHPKFMDIEREPSFEDPDQSTVSTALLL